MSWFYEYCGSKTEDWDFKFNSLPKHVQKDAGQFNTYSIYELKFKLSCINKLNNPLDIKELCIIIRKKYIKEELFDTSSIQKSNGSNIMVQVASNFNCLEVSSHDTNPFKASFVQDLMYDTTQGPSAAGGAIAGTLQRIAQHKIKSINLLEETSLEPTNGKLYYRKNKTYDFDRLSVKISLQTNVRANFLRKSNTYEYDQNGPIIDQVYTSTCITYGDSNNLATQLLKSAYEGTYLSAIIRQSKKLFLTLIGGGCFNNNKTDIFDTIIIWHILYSQYLSDDCQIILPIYMPDINLIKCIVKHFKPYSFVRIVYMD